MERMNFGKNFISWIKTLYTDIRSSCINNGYMSTSFNPSRGIRQGCPVSALLFIIVAEVLATNLRSCTKVSGISVENPECLIIQLGDDTTLFVNDAESLLNAIYIIEKFTCSAGLKLNKAKTKIFYLGNTNHKPIVALHPCCKSLS